MRTLLTATACLTLFFGVQTDAAKEDLKKLQGTWDLVSIVMDAKDTKVGPQSKWTFQDKKVSYSSNPEDFDVIMSLDPSKSPRTIDFKSVRKGKDDQNFKAVYKFEDERLIICVDPTGKAYPTSFESKDGSGHRLVTLLKAKK